MADATPSRLGQANAAGDALALFLKVFSGQVLTAFDRESAARSRHLVRTIPSGKSAQFPVTGLAQAYYHTPGNEITGRTIRHGERIINIEDVLVAPVFVANIDELMNHYDVQSIYSNEIGQALAKRYDQDVLRTAILNARGAAILDDLQGGAALTDTDYDTDGDKLWAALFNAGVTLDTKDVPTNDRYAFIRPVQYALVVQSDKAVDRDFNRTGNGDLATGRVELVNNIPLVKTNNLPSADDRANTDIPAIRRADYSPTQAVVMHRNAVGTVQLQDVTMESMYDMRRQGTLMLGKYLVGHDKLRPEAGVEIRTAAPAV